MTNPDADIHDFEIRKYILRLINFFGQTTIEKYLANYQKSLSSSGPVFKEYYLMTRHPWWESLEYFFELERKGKSVKRNLDTRLKRLAADSQTLSILQQNMPEKIKRKYKIDLTDDERAQDYLFELHIAWHYHLRGHEIVWYTEDGCPEFLVKTPNFDFNVECKRISVDGSRKIRRRDLYRFVEILLPRIHDLKLKGTIELELNERLHSNNQHLEDLSCQVLDVVKEKNTGIFSIPLGKVSLDLTQSNNEIVDFKTRYNNLMSRKSHESHGVIFAKEKNGKPVDPVELIIKSNKADKVIDGIKRKIQKAIENQLPSNNPGIVCCFLEDIAELNDLASDSALQTMSCYILDKQKYSHVAAISYCSEERIIKYEDSENYNFQGLLFRNPNCSFENAKDFPFLSKEINSL